MKYLFALVCTTVFTISHAQRFDLENKSYKIKMDIDTCCRLFNGTEIKEKCYCIIDFSKSKFNIEIYNSNSDKLMHAMWGSKGGKFKLASLSKEGLHQEHWEMETNDTGEHTIISIRYTEGFFSGIFSFSWIIWTTGGNTYVTASKTYNK